MFVLNIYLNTTQIVNLFVDNSNTFYSILHAEINLNEKKINLFDYTISLIKCIGNFKYSTDIINLVSQIILRSAYLNDEECERDLVKFNINMLCYSILQMYFIPIPKEFMYSQVNDYLFNLFWQLLNLIEEYEPFNKKKIDPSSFAFLIVCLLYECVMIMDFGEENAINTPEILKTILCGVKIN